jgi:metallo-beta-lactamase family protein
VRCHVEHLDGFSAHADRTELLRWLDQFQPPPQRTFVVHGEPPAAESLAATLRERHWPGVEVPDYLESVSLFEGI